MRTLSKPNRQSVNKSTRNAIADSEKQPMLGNLVGSGHSETSVDYSLEFLTMREKATVTDKARLMTNIRLKRKDEDKHIKTKTLLRSRNNKEMQHEKH